MKKKFFVTFLALAILFTFSLTVNAAEFRIGVPVALTGIFGKAGALVRDAYTFWAEMVNKRGGINGYKVKLIFYDDKSTPATSAKLVEKLITTDKVDLILGGYGSSQVFAASAIAEKYKYPMISGGASSNKLFERGFKYYFATLGKATEEVKGCVDVFTSVKPKPKTVAIVGADILFTSLACEGYKKYCKENGFKIVHFELFPIRLQDYNTMLGKAKKKNPDILLVGSHLMVAMKTIKAMKEIDFSPKAVAFSYGPTVPDFVKGLGKDAEYVYAASEWTPNLPYKDKYFGSASDFNQNYYKRFKRYPDYVEAAAAAGALAQQIALENLKIKPPVKQKDRVAIMKELHKINIMTFYGPIKFGEDGANIAHPPVAVQVQNGKLVNVYPPEGANAKPIYPMPKWNERK